MSAQVVQLPRGGLWTMTPAGPVQLGAPAETIKDTLGREGGVPRVFLLPRTLVDMRRGRTNCDLEFPIYFHLFAKKQALIVVGPADLEGRLRTALQESLLGPRELSVEELRQDVGAGVRVPDIGREHLFFKKGPYRTGLLDLHDALDFRAIERGPHDVGGGVEVLADADGGYQLRWEGAVQARLPAEPPLVELPRASSSGGPPFVPPRFGVTVLGRSHGFDPDPNEKTSGFVLWVGGRGIMVDPPVRSTELLAAADVDNKLIDGVLLTHCHADHDAGTLEKALEAGRVTLFTIPTIWHSYKRKWSALTGIPQHEIEKLFDYRPVRVGEPTALFGATFLFRFSLHSIPTIAFEVHLDGRSFNYSADHLNDPRQIEAIYAAGHMDRERREELLHFNWSHDLIFHEAGVPPLHTPLELLQALPADVRARTYVLHTTPSRVPPNTGLQLAVAGAQGTLDLKVEAPPEARVLRTLSLLGRARLFATLPLERAAELLAASKEVRVKAGERFITAGQELKDGDDVLYVVTGGRASVRRNGRHLKTYSLGDYIGETAVFLSRPRNADVFAETDLALIAVDGKIVRRVCEGTAIPELVQRHAQVREWDAWGFLEETSLFAGLTSTQKNDLETILHPTSWRKGTTLVRVGEKAGEIFLVVEGSVELQGEDGDDDTGGARGCVVGDVAALMQRRPQPRGGRASTKGRGFSVQRADLAWFLDKNPGIKVRVQPWNAEVERSAATSSLLALLEDYL